MTGLWAAIGILSILLVVLASEVSDLKRRIRALENERFRSYDAVVVDQA
jgi:hypothetical protein